MQTKRNVKMADGTVEREDVIEGYRGIVNEGVGWETLGDDGAKGKEKKRGTRRETKREKRGEGGCVVL
jgi:hypothetical protein